MKKPRALSGKLATYSLSGLTRAGAIPTPDVGEPFVKVCGRVWNKTTDYGYERLSTQNFQPVTARFAV